MSDPIEQRKSKERSPSFPFISLAVALDRARQFYDKEKRGSAPYLVVAEHWRYSPSSSGALQTAAALKSYGLFVDEGSGASRKLKLTDLALRILLDTRPDSTERKQYMRQAAIAPSVIEEIYSKWPKALPSDATLNHYLVLERGFSQSSALRAVKIIQQNEELTNLCGQDELSADNMIEELKNEPSYPMEQSTTYPVSAAGTKVGLIRTERLIDPEGIDVLLQFNGEPTVASYQFLNDYIELRIKALQRTNAANKKDN